MKYRWLLGLLVSLTGCGKDDDGALTGGSGGSTGQVGGTAGSSTKGGSGGSIAPGGGTTASGGTTTGGTSNTPTAGTAPGTGGTSKGGAGNGGGANSPSGGSATAGTSTGGQATAGAPPSGGSGGAPPTSAGSVLERNGSPTREGHWIQPGLTKAAAAKMVLEDSFKATFQGRMYASPLYAANGPGGKGVFVAVSADNVVAALDETTGATVWTKTLGTAPGGKGQACFGSDPVGILSTPVIDEKSKTLYIAAAVGVASSGKGPERHELHALSLDDGSPRQGWPVNVNTLKADGVAFNAPVQNQRSALSLVNGIVYVGYGGYVGDCGDYRGWIVAVDAADPTKTGAWATRGKGDAIWAAGGFASDGTNIFPVTGNNMANASSRDQTDSEAILKISGLAKFERNDQNQFYPSTWKSMDSADADFGGSNTILVRLPGATPERILVAVAKDGKLYLVDPNDLGGSDGQIDVLDAASVGQAAGSGVRTAPAAYTTSKGTYVALSVQSGANCPNNMTGAVVMGVRIEPGGPTANVEWCAAGGQPYAAPIATTTDGKADAIVWYVVNGQLRGVDGDTGASVFQGSGMCSGVEKWTSPIAVKNRIVVGGSGKLCSWKPQ
jgi:hypothetical protein